MCTPTGRENSVLTTVACDQVVMGFRWSRGRRVGLEVRGRLRGLGWQGVVLGVRGRLRGLGLVGMQRRHLLPGPLHCQVHAPPPVSYQCIWFKNHMHLILHTKK